MAELPSETTPDSETPTVYLPAELQILIWKATLSPRRVLEISLECTATEEDEHINWTWGLKFENRRPPPVALHVCRAWRYEIMKNSAFLVDLDDKRGGFFRPAVDLLFFSGEQWARSVFQPESSGVFSGHGWKKVQHIGFEWDGLDTRLWPGKFALSWREAPSLRKVMPDLLSIAWVTWDLPGVFKRWIRRRGGRPRKRPGETAYLLESLPEDTVKACGVDPSLGELPSLQVTWEVLEELVRRDPNISYWMHWGAARKLFDETWNGVKEQSRTAQDPWAREEEVDWQQRTAMREEGTKPPLEPRGYALAQKRGFSDD